MSRSRVVRSVQVAIVALSIIGGGTARAEIVLGASLGYTHLSYPDLPSKTDVIGVPGTEAWGQPGFRVGYLSPGHVWGVNADVGIVHWSQGGTHETTVELLPQVQATTRGPGWITPSVNVGVGIVHKTEDFPISGTISATRPVFGGGVGVQKSVSDGHGFVRAELRYDHMTERVKKLSPLETAGFPAIDLFSVKFGFDLLVGR